MRNFLIIFTLFILGLIVKPYFYKPSLSETIKSSYVNVQERKSLQYHAEDTRYPFSIRSITAQIPYASNMTLFQEHKEVTRLILAIHSSSYNPNTYLENSVSLFEDDANLHNKTLIIAPAFYRKDKTSLSDIVTWSVSPFWGSSRALYQTKKIELSAYEVLDDILTRMITSKYFPNLSSIVILGHSAGGQMVNRYAACNTIEDKVALDHNIMMKYLVMAPSSYVYLDGRRIKKYNNEEFKFPFGANEKYNYWGYGLEQLYSYHKRHNITADAIRFNYKYRKVLYLVGEKDTEDFALDKSKSAMREGRNRLERLKIYYNYLKIYYGEEVTDYQSMSIILNAGHSGRVLMNSDEGKRFILDL